MNKTLFFIIILAFTLTGCSTKMVSPAGSDFWTNHGIIQLLGWFFFPRIMFWFFSVITGGFWFWVGVFFAPRIMVAFWATTYYWHTNTILCVFAWIYALAGEGTEKTVMSGG